MCKEIIAQSFLISVGINIVNLWLFDEYVKNVDSIASFKLNGSELSKSIFCFSDLQVHLKVLRFLFTLASIHFL